jgi:TonB family protein
MREAAGTVEATETERPARDLRLLIKSESWSTNFWQNLTELFRRNEPVRGESFSATFWSDVFVDRGLPWNRFLQSGAYHVLALALIWAGSRFLALQPHATVQTTLTHADVIYYTPVEYLPPVDTRRITTARAQNADPENSAQPIISVPPEADNHSQTIVAPPHIQLRHDVSVPNIVAWQREPQLPIGPVPVVLASETSRLAPRVESAVISPPSDLPSDVQRDSRVNRQAALTGPQPAVIAPPPAMEADGTRHVGDLDIGQSSVIAPAPQLSLEEQRTLMNRGSAALSRRSPQVIAPPPSMHASGGFRPDGNMIALSLHPAVGAPADPPAGNRRGSFASTPEGHHGASGAAGVSVGDGTGKANGSRVTAKSNSDIPSDLYVGKRSTPVASPVAGNPSSANSNAYSVNPNLIANARPPRLSTHTLQAESDSRLSDVERAVFGNRKFYSLSLNMPNLNSAGGSWIIRFAALKGEPNSAGSYSRRAAAAGASPDASSHDRSSQDDLSAPSATRKVDPAYPLELMRQHVGGTVILYGVIHTDGTVGNIRVLRSVDEQLDRFASEAIAKWQFQPATKNGAPVDVEATFWIPFRPAQTESNF